MTHSIKPKRASHENKDLSLGDKLTDASERLKDAVGSLGEVADALAEAAERSDAMEKAVKKNVATLKKVADLPEE